MRLKTGLALGLTLLACAGHARDLQTIRQSGELKVGVPGDYAPLAFHNQAGELLGYDVDMAKDLGKTLGLKVSFVATSWPTLAADLQADKFDIAMGGVTRTPERAKAFALSRPVVANGKIALANCSAAPSLGSLAQIDRPQVKVVVNPGGTNQSYVDAHIKHAQIIRVKNNVDNLQALRDKSADMMVTDLIEGDWYQGQEPGVFCVATAKPLPGTESDKVYMVRRDNPQLLEKVDQWLAKQDPAALKRKWKLAQ
ncbi:transporter substrate-binding domain-containing protein [Pluralibacter gergoviae]|uniref:Transporter substrate-binding domain-containing protein n=1 Tax=Pluralibacter gergoviae TaxID=61647 RepID=A0AAW8HUQ5_PLUGE|nr:transporter substrate-binding domain-containing protein [Pluralibacter gergoviae]AIR00220.1 amino acid ABC transporter substrate-binding protein [Pluralibacter gergoviae]AVR05559.1 amino acid ABC transporter substrate-binding protein [Pluralibacter gergoviae]EKV0930771.1 transporter substrate-binding domain-containing protein [Pluralibacter gergoviae]EKV6249034.1 transporter substrate-binding domain-containing protein [Pluralibacter gergoviae]EKW9967283.1 transporter substrate-binding domai